MIYTCTTNPSLDYYITLPKIDRGVMNRSEVEMFDAGGKGVNVSVVLNNFRIPNVATGFLGGFTKDYFLQFIANYPNIQPLFTTIADNTRINVKIMDDEFETSINAKGPHISDEEFERFRKRLQSVYADDIFVISGNIEDEIVDRMVDLIREMTEEGVKVVLDTDRHIIERCRNMKTFAIKLNYHNTDESIPLEEDSARLLQDGTQNVLYSAPGKNSYIFTNDGSYTCSDLAGSLVNVTGSADSMVAGFLYGIIRGADTRESFRYANAASLATSMSNDLGSKEKIEEMYANIEVSQI